MLIAQAKLAMAETTLAQSRGALADRQVDVFLALGGWPDAPPMPLSRDRAAG